MKIRNNIFDEDETPGFHLPAKVILKGPSPKPSPRAGATEKGETARGEGLRERGHVPFYATLDSTLGKLVKKSLNFGG